MPSVEMVSDGQTSDGELRLAITLEDDVGSKSGVGFISKGFWLGLGQYMGWIPTKGTHRERMEAFERAIIEDALQATSGNQSAAARLLRMPLRTLVYKLKAYKAEDGHADTEEVQGHG